MSEQQPFKMALGIDFGTTNTAVAFFDNTDPAKKIHSIPYQGTNASLLMKKTIPSVVFFNEMGLPEYYGERALDAGKSKPHLMVDKIKRVIGKTYEEAQKDPLLKKIAFELVAGKVISEKSKDQPEAQHEAIVRVGEVKKVDYLPEDIAAMIFEEAKKDAEAYLRGELGYENLDYDWIVITFPANFNVIQRGKVKEAAIKAGFNEEKLRFVNEPTAAAFDAVFERKITEKTDEKKYEVLVLNIGSGTTDLALVELREARGRSKGLKANTFATGGDSALGGTDMDIAIVDWVVEELRKNPNVNPNLFSKAGKQLLRFFAEDAKISISEGNCEKTRVRIPGFEAIGPILDEKKLNSIAKHVVSQCIAEYNNILAKTKIKDSNYNEIILTGGPMAMSVVRNLITSEFVAPNFVCASCDKQLHGTRSSDEFLRQTKGLPENKKAIAKTEAWFYAHDLEGDKPENRNCHDHLVFSDRTHFEVSVGSDDGFECTVAGKVDLRQRNHYVVEGSSDSPFDPMMCVARGAAISPLFDYVTVAPNAIRVLVRGNNTSQQIKTLIELDTQLPARVHQSLTANPWEANFEIHVLQDKEAKYDSESDTYYGDFTNWGYTSYPLNPCRDEKKVYVGIDANKELDEIQLFLFEDESILANWITDPIGFKGLPLRFVQKGGVFPINPPEGAETTRLWAALWRAIFVESSSGYKLLHDTLSLFFSANTLQKDGYKLSSEASAFLDKVSPSFGPIYAFMDSEVEKLNAQKPAEKELSEAAKKVAQTILRDVKYEQLTKIMMESDWETNLANMAISGEAIKLLISNIESVTSRVNQLGQKADKSIISLSRSLESDLQFFQNYGNRGEILLKSKEGTQFIEARRKLAALETNIRAMR